MLIVTLASLLLIAATTLIHYEALRLMNTRLLTLPIANRRKLLVLIFAAFLVHFVEIGVYAGAIYGLVAGLGVGTLDGASGFSFVNCLYFSAETYTTLGFGDLTPSGPIRVLAGVESLNGLLLIGWTATSSYVAMERFWSPASNGEKT